MSNNKFTIKTITTKKKNSNIYGDYEIKYIIYYKNKKVCSFPNYGCAYDFIKLFSTKSKINRYFKKELKNINNEIKNIQKDYKRELNELKKDIKLSKRKRQQQLKKIQNL